MPNTGSDPRPQTDAGEGVMTGYTKSFHTPKRQQLKQSDDPALPLNPLPFRMPRAPNFDEDYGTIDQSGSGDSMLNPNQQRAANSVEGGGTALPEIVLRMRLITLVICGLAMGLEVPMWLGREVEGNLAALSLAVMVCIFSLALCCYELQVPVVADAIRTNLGIVSKPYGRSLFWAFLGGLCIGQGGLEMIMGGAILLTALYSIYVPCRYPAYDKAHTDVGGEDLRRIARRKWADRKRHRAWADPGVRAQEGEIAPILNV